MPTHGRTGLKRVFLGSTAERVVQYSPCPVLIARKRKVKPNGATEFDDSACTGIDTILVPVDFSSCSLEGLKYAVGFADRIAARVIALNVVNVGPLLTGDGYAMYDMSSYREFMIKQADGEMNKFLRSVKFGPVKVETLVDEGPPVAVITRIAQEKKADLIITATLGRTGFDHFLIGSTAEAVVRHAPCSVLVVPSFAPAGTNEALRQNQSRQSEAAATNNAAIAER
jgi:nucleotide-binding universal stress UspA family protein